MYPSYLFKFCLLPACLVVVQVVAAQQVEKKLSSNELAHTWWVQVCPTIFTEPEIPIAATVLYKLKRHVGLALDAGVYIARHDGTLFTGSTYLPYSGFRLRPTAKFYVDGSKNKPTGIYLAAQGIIKNTSKTNQDWLTNANNMQSFSQLVTYKERKWVYGMSFLFGVEVLLGPSEKWLLDFYGGLGFRFKKFKADGLPPGFTIDYDRRDDLGNRRFSIYQNGSYIDAPLGFKIGYRLK